MVFKVEGLYFLTINTLFGHLDLVILYQTLPHGPDAESQFCQNESICICPKHAALGRNLLLFIG